MPRSLQRSGLRGVQLLVQAASMRMERYGPQDWRTKTSLQHQLAIKPKRSGRSRENPKSVLKSAPGMGGLGAPLPRGLGSQEHHAAAALGRQGPAELVGLPAAPCCERGRGCWAGSAPYHPRAGRGCGCSRHLWPHPGESRLPGSAQASPSKHIPPPPPLHLLAKHPPRLPKLQAYSHLPGWLQLPGEVLVFPAQPDSAQSLCTPLSLLGRGVWYPGGRRLGAPIAFASGPVVISCIPSPAPNLFLFFIPHGQGMLSAGPRLLACSASRSASRLGAGGGWYGVEVGVLGCFSSICGRRMESLRHSPGEGTGTSGEQWESIDSSCSIINFL